LGRVDSVAKTRTAPLDSIAGRLESVTRFSKALAQISLVESDTVRTRDIIRMISKTLFSIIFGCNVTLQVRLQMHLAHSSRIVSLVDEDKVASTSTTPILIIMLLARLLTETLHREVATSSRVTPSSALMLSNNTCMMSSAASMSWASMS
jgi:hypothetical protein